MEHCKHFPPYLSIDQLQNHVDICLDKKKYLENYFLDKITNYAYITKHRQYSESERDYYYGKRADFLALYRQLTQR